MFPFNEDTCCIILFGLRCMYSECNLFSAAAANQLKYVFASKAIELMPYIHTHTDGKHSIIIEYKPISENKNVGSFLLWPSLARSLVVCWHFGQSFIRLSRQLQSQLLSSFHRACVCVCVCIFDLHLSGSNAQKRIRSGPNNKRPFN